MSQQKIIFDATLLVNAYETQVFRTGLFRVCDELLKKLIDSGKYEIFLYDIFGRERHLRQYVISNYTGTGQELSQVSVFSQDSNVFRTLAYPVLRKADGWRRKEDKQFYCKVLKAIAVRFGRLVEKLSPRKKMVDAVDASYHYIATYYSIPQWVHDAGMHATLIVHDLIPILHPEYFASDANKRLLEEICSSISANDMAVCVSASTRSDLLNFRKDLNPDNVKFAHLAGADCFRKRDLSFDNLQPFNYILSACTLEPRKNMLTLVKAYKLLLTKHNGQFMPLVLTGAMGWKTGKLFEDIEELNSQYRGKIIITGYVSDEELAGLYSNTSVFVYPSLYEGFGLPPLEAMQCGAPVVVSNKSSLPEVVGEAGVMVDPLDVESIAEAIDSVSADRDRRSRLSIERASQFNWDKFAKVVMETL